MKRHLLLYTLLALCLVPAASLKAQSSDGIILNKTVTDEKNALFDNQPDYTITLEAFATGTKVTTVTEKVVPNDIVLVLDNSGSMSNNNITTIGTRVAGTINDENTYFIKINGNAFYLKRFYRQSNSTYYWNYKEGSAPSSRREGTTLSNAQQLDADSYEIYTQATITRKKGLQQAAATFIESVYANNPEDGYHKIAIVWYGQYAKPGNTLGDYQLHDLTESVKNSLVTKFTDGTEIPSTGSNTYCDLGLEQAYNTLYAARKDGRNKVTVFFTDGEPGSNAGKFAESTARSSIAQSNKLKSADLTNTIDGTAYPSRVYAIGLMTNGTADYHNTGTGSGTGAKVTNDKYRFMHYTSSNYDISGINIDRYHFNEDLNVTCQSKLANGGTCTGHGSEEPHGYFTKSDGANLNDIFATIANESSQGTSSVDLDETSVVVVDVMSNYFLLPEGIEATEIKTYTALCTGYDATKNEFIFATPEQQPYTVSVKPDTREVDVMGFDFADNYVYEDATVTPKRYGGYKLIIEIPIVVDPANPGGANLVTNNKELSGVYTGGKLGTDGKITYQDKFAGFPKPMVVKPNIVIQKTGLRRKGESATFMIERVADKDGNPYTAGTDKPYFVSLTQTENMDSHDEAINPENALVAKVKLLEEGWYRVTETSWSSWYTAKSITEGYSMVPDLSKPTEMVYDTESEWTNNTSTTIELDGKECPCLIRYVGKSTETLINPPYSVGTLYKFVNTLIGSTTRDPEKYSEANKINVFPTKGSGTSN